MAIGSAFLQKCAPYCVKTFTDLSGFLPQQSLNNVLYLDPLRQDGQGETLHRLKLKFICELRYKMNIHISCEKTWCQLQYFLSTGSQKNLKQHSGLCYTIQQRLEVHWSGDRQLHVRFLQYFYMFDLLVVCSMLQSL